MRQKQRLACTSLVVSMAVVGPLVAPMVGGLFASCFGWRSCFSSVAAASSVLFILSCRWLEETAPVAFEGTYGASLRRVLLHGRRMLIVVAMGMCKGFFVAWSESKSQRVKRSKALRPSKRGSSS